MLSISINILFRRLYTPKIEKPAVLKVNNAIPAKCKKSGDQNDIPKHLEAVKEKLEKKNIFWDFKRIEPPRQQLADNFVMNGNMEENGNRAFEDLKNCKLRKCQTYKKI